jgi:predicted TIM-barrel fold metal-dependent hydrolase
MDRWSDWCTPAGWKVYTMYGVEGRRDRTWMLDDDETGEPFLDRVMETGVRTVSAHKGLSSLISGVDTGWDGASSPRDVGPVAAAYPGINFIIFHSGYEPRQGDEEEGPYVERDAPRGTDRLIKSLKDAGVGPGGNVYAELGSTWYMVMPHPREAAHVMGKLLLALGEDNVVWGTDSIWYGPAQPLIDAFRAYEIPEEYCEQYGYPRLTASVKEKILGLNAARIYNVDVEQARATIGKDDLSWVKAAMEEFSRSGTPTIG